VVIDGVELRIGNETIWESGMFGTKGVSDLIFVSDSDFLMCEYGHWGLWLIAYFNPGSAHYDAEV